MNLCKSVLFGCEGNYQFFDTKLKFQSKTTDKTVSNVNTIKQCLFTTIRVASQLHLHTFVHQMGHILAEKLLMGVTSSEISIVTFNDKLHPVVYKEAHKNFNTRLSLVEAAGPLAHVAFCIVKLAVAVLFTNYITFPVAFALGSVAFGYITADVLGAALSRGRDDFGYIAKNSKTHYAMAMFALITEVALGALIISAQL